MNLNLENLNEKYVSKNESQTISVIYNLLHNDDTVRWNRTNIKLRSPKGLTQINKIAFRSFTGDLLPYTSLELPKLKCDVYAYVYPDYSSKNAVTSITGEISGSQNTEWIDYDVVVSNKKATKIASYDKAWSYDSTQESQIDHNITEMLRHINQTFSSFLGDIVHNIFYSNTTYSDSYHRYTLTQYDEACDKNKFKYYNRIPPFGMSSSIVLQCSTEEYCDEYCIMTVNDEKEGIEYDVHKLDIPSQYGDFSLHSLLIAYSETVRDSTTNKSYRVFDYVDTQINNAVLIYQDSDENTLMTINIKDFQATSYCEGIPFALCDYACCAISKQGYDSSYTLSLYITKYSKLIRLEYSKLNLSQFSEIIPSCIYFDNDTDDIHLYVIGIVGNEQIFRRYLITSSDQFDTFTITDRAAKNVYSTIDVSTTDITYSYCHFRTLYDPNTYTIFECLGGFLYSMLLKSSSDIYSNYIQIYPTKCIQIRDDYIVYFPKTKFEGDLDTLELNPVNSTTLSGEVLKTIYNNKYYTDTSISYPNILAVNKAFALYTDNTYDATLLVTPTFYDYEFISKECKALFYNDDYIVKDLEGSLTQDPNISYSLANTTNNDATITNSVYYFDYYDKRMTYPYILFGDSSDYKIVSFIPVFYTEPYYFSIRASIPSSSEAITTISTYTTDVEIQTINDEALTLLETLLVLQYEYNDLMLRCSNFTNNDNIVFSVNEICRIKFKEMQSSSNVFDLDITVCDSSGNAIELDTLKKLYGKLVLCIDFSQ